LSLARQLLASQRPIGSLQAATSAYFQDSDWFGGIGGVGSNPLDWIVLFLMTDAGQRNARETTGCRRGGASRRSLVDLGAGLPKANVGSRRIDALLLLPIFLVKPRMIHREAEARAVEFGTTSQKPGGAATILGVRHQPHGELDRCRIEVGPDEPPSPLRSPLACAMEWMQLTSVL